MRTLISCVNFGMLCTHSAIPYTHFRHFMRAFSYGILCNAHTWRNFSVWVQPWSLNPSTYNCGQHVIFIGRSTIRHAQNATPRAFTPLKNEQSKEMLRSPSQKLTEPYVVSWQCSDGSRSTHGDMAADKMRTSNSSDIRTDWSELVKVRLGLG